MDWSNVNLNIIIKNQLSQKLLNIIRYLLAFKYLLAFTKNRSHRFSFFYVSKGNPLDFYWQTMHFDEKLIKKDQKKKER